MEVLSHRVKSSGVRHGLVTQVAVNTRFTSRRREPPLCHFLILKSTALLRPQLSSFDRTARIPRLLKFGEGIARASGLTGIDFAIVVRERPDEGRSRWRALVQTGLSRNMADKPSTERHPQEDPSAGRWWRICGEAGGRGSGTGVVEAPAAEETAAPAKPAATAAPKGTSDILASIRGDGGTAKPAAKEDAPAEKPKPAAAPKGTASILASIRSQGADAGAPAAAPKAPAKKKAAAAVPAGDLPPVSEMLQKMKAGKGTAAAPAKAAPAKPQLKIPTKPAKKAAEPETRRNFLLALVATPFALAWTLLATFSGVWVLAIARFMFPNVLVELPSRFPVGPPTDFPPESVSTKFTAARGIWIIRTAQYNGKDLIYALSSVCTHLGCTPSWLEGEQKFKCPCHGSGFYKNGINFEGPAPRPLERVGIRIAADGSLEVDKSVKFQEEKGQWEDTKSFVDAALV